MTDASKESVTRRGSSVQYKTKGEARYLPSKGRGGVKLPVEVKNLDTHEILTFPSMSEAARYLHTYLEGMVSLNTLTTQVSIHIRKPHPTPYHRHLVRIKATRPQAWPDYSHLDLDRINNTRIKILYPLFVEDIKAGVIIECYDLNDVKSAVKNPQFERLSVYLNNNVAYRKRYKIRKQLNDVTPMPDRRKEKFRYDYLIEDVYNNTKQHAKTMPDIATRTGVRSASIQVKFFKAKTDCIYVGDNNRYKITRTRR